MRKFALLTSMLVFAFVAKAQEVTSLPTDADANKCYVQCIKPTTFKTVEETVMVKPGYTTLKVMPAEYNEVTETVVVKEASKRYEFVPAEYETVTMSYTSEEPYNAISITPATFGTGSASIVTTPKLMRWESQPYEGCQSDNPEDCQVWCYRSYDPITTTIATQTLAQDASFAKAQAGGKTATYTMQKLVKAAEVREIEVPQETKQITKRVLVKDEYTVEEKVEPVYQTVAKQVIDVQGGQPYLSEIECELLEYSVLPITFPSGSASLTSSAKNIINTKLYQLMKDKSGVRVELNAHTDSQGSASSNKVLSERRAQSVANYLIAKGISSSRLVTKGYGEEKLKNKCADGVPCTPAEHAVNRRVEFRILSY